MLWRKISADCLHLRGRTSCVPTAPNADCWCGQDYSPMTQQGRTRTMKRSLAAAGLGAIAAASLAAAAFAGPSFDKDGKLVLPEGRDRWPMVGATYALSYEGDGGVTINTVRLD